MKERLQHHLSDVGESFDYLRSDIRNLSRYMAELENLIEGYRTFAANAMLSQVSDRAALRKLLKRTLKVIGPPPDKQPEEPDPCSGSSVSSLHTGPASGTVGKVNQNVEPSPGALSTPTSP